jgi:hypothetical protein
VYDEARGFQMAPPPDPGGAAAAAAVPVPVNLPLTGISPPSCLDVDDGNVVESWKLWKQMWTNYIVVAKLEDQTEVFRVALFLHAIGPKALKIFNAMQFGTDEDRNTLAHILKKYDEHFIGETNQTYERFIFNSRNQESSESIEGYVTALRTLAQTCNFCNCLNDTLLRDHIVLGVKDNHTRKRLLQERKLTLKKCIDVCSSMESSASQLKSLGGEKAEVNRVSSKPKGHKNTKHSSKSYTPKLSSNGKPEI